MRDYLLAPLEDFIAAHMRGGGSVFGLHEIKAGMVEAGGLGREQATPCDEDDQAIIAYLDRHPRLVRAAVGREAVLWRFGVNTPTRRRPIGR